MVEMRAELARLFLLASKSCSCLLFFHVGRYDMLVCSYADMLLQVHTGTYEAVVA